MPPDYGFMHIYVNMEHIYAMTRPSAAPATAVGHGQQETGRETLLAPERDTPLADSRVPTLWTANANSTGGRPMNPRSTNDPTSNVRMPAPVCSVGETGRNPCEIRALSDAGTGDWRSGRGSESCFVA